MKKNRLLILIALTLLVGGIIIFAVINHDPKKPIDNEPTNEIYGEQTGISEGTGKLPETATTTTDTEAGGIGFAEDTDPSDEDIAFNEYLNSDEFKESKAEEDLPLAEIPTEVTDGIEVEPLDQVMYAVSSVNLREKDNADSKKVGSLNYAQEVNVVGQSIETKWFQIKMSDGTLAYVSNNYLSLKRPTRQTKVVEQQPAAPGVPSTPAMPDMSGLGGSFGVDTLIDGGEANSSAGATGEWAGVEIY